MEQPKTWMRWEMRISHLIHVFGCLYRVYPVLLKHPLHLLQAQAQTTFDRSQRNMVVFSNFRVGISSEIGQFNYPALLLWELLQNRANDRTLLFLPRLHPYLRLIAQRLLLAFRLQRRPLLFPVAGRTHLINGAVMYNSLQPAIDAPILSLVRIRLAPDR